MEVIGMKNRTSFAFVLTGIVAFVGAGLACSSSDDNKGATVTCGPGTTLEGASCVAIPVDTGVPGGDSSTVTCGPGTTLKDGVCVVVSDGVGPTFAGLASVTSTTTTTARLTWLAASDPKTTPDRISYRIYVSDKTGTETYGSPQYTSLPGKLTFDVTGLDPGGTYFFVVRAVNAAGIEDKNVVEKSVTTSNDETPPQFAGLLYVDFIAPVTGTVGQAKLNWSPASDDKTGASEIVYEVYESLTPGGENFAGAPKTTVTGASDATIDGADYAISHYYVVLARDKSGNKNPNKVERKLQKVPNLTDHIMPIFAGIPGVSNSAKCAREGGCHLGPSAPSGLAMDTPDNAYAGLVRVNAASRYVPWTLAEITGGTPTTIAVEAGVLPMGNVSFTATAAQLGSSFAPYNETQVIRVIPGFPLASFMYWKITNTHKRTKSNDPGNAEMPNPASSGATLTSEERERIRLWIAGGALKGPA
jgi:hypothetical protein